MRACSSEASALSDNLRAESRDSGSTHAFQLRNPASCHVFISTYTRRKQNTVPSVEDGQESSAAHHAQLAGARAGSTPRLLIRKVERPRAARLAHAFRLARGPCGTRSCNSEIRWKNIAMIET